MAKNYTGSLSLEWFNKQKSILIQEEEKGKVNNDVPAPKLNWINKDDALFYEIIDDEGRGLKPFWVDLSDIRVKEARPLVLKKSLESIEKQQTKKFFDKEYEILESNKDKSSIENMLIRGDNLLSLNSIKKLFESRPDEEKVKCVYIDPPFNTGQAFEHYDDNLAHSEWLTMVRDRLVILRNLIKEDGFIFVHLDDAEVHLTRLVLDEIFGRQNFVNQICYERSGSAGIGQGAELVDTAEFILVYAKNREIGELNIVQENFPLDYETMKRYNKCIVDEGRKELIKSFNSKSNGELAKIYKHIDYKLESVSLRDFEKREDEIKNWYKKNFTTVFRTTNPQQENTFQNEVLGYMEGGLYSMEYIPSRGKNKNQLTNLFYLDNGIFAWLKDTASISDNEVTKQSRLKTVWEHKAIPKADLANEGGVSFKRGKKPEQLLKRIFDLSTKEGDLVLDCFGGSGTTFAVASKMKRRWIGVEIGEQAETHIVPRLKRILSGEDQSGISKAVNWQGGGSFKYYTLGESIIDTATRDFNWKLGRKFIEESLLSTYDFNPDKDFTLKQEYLQGDASLVPVIGFQTVGARTLAAVVSLAEPSESMSLMSYDEIMNLYKSLKEHNKVYAVTIFTNRGVELAYESKPEDLEVVKVPQAIFANLENY